MDQPTQFRSAFNGFNREDVVRYLEYINNKHSAQVAQLSNELEFARSKEVTVDDSQVEELEARISELMDENDALHNRIEELEQKLQAANEAVEVQKKLARGVSELSRTTANEELKAYRRAERTERMAKERANQIGEQTASALAEASNKVDVASELIGQIGKQVAEQMDMALAAVKSSRQAFQDAAGIIEQLRADMKDQD